MRLDLVAPPLQCESGGAWLTITAREMEALSSLSQEKSISNNVESPVLTELLDLLRFASHTRS